MNKKHRMWNMYIDAEREETVIFKATAEGLLLERFTMPTGSVTRKEMADAVLELMLEKFND